MHLPARQSEDAEVPIAVVKKCLTPGTQLTSGARGNKHFRFPGLNRQ